MGQYKIKDVQNRAELLKENTDNVYRAIYTRTGRSPETLDQVPGIIMSIPHLPTQEPLTITPTKKGRTYRTPVEKKYNPITVEPVTSAIDSNIRPENIREGVSILDVVGTHKGEKPEESFDVQPTTSEQTITPYEGAVFSGGTVHAVTSAIDSNIQPENIKEGVSILGVAGTLSAGGGSDVFVVHPDTKFGYSTFTKIPSNYDFREFSNVTNASYLFYNCSRLTTIPQIDLSRAKNIQSMFQNCTGLTTVPLLDLSSATNASYLFYNCSKLTTIPQIDLHSATDIQSMFYGCSSLITIPQIDLSSAKYWTSAFYSCYNLTTVPVLNSSKAQSMSSVFQNCEKLTTVEGIDFSGLTSSLYNLFGYSSNMSKLTRFIVNGKINVNISDEYSIAALRSIDYDSVKSILEAANRTDNTNAKTLAFNRTMTDQNGELAALVASCTSKGWTISGLTLQ